jgi:Zn-dependent M28 family amino/carboxypeptidase
MRALLPLLFTSFVVFAQTPKVQEAPLRAHLAFLADDLLEGRGTGARGGALAVAYLESQLRKLGLKPLQGDSFRQEVLLDGARLRKNQSSLAIASPLGELPLRFDQDAVLSTGQVKAGLTFDAPLVFAGYGIHAPEADWDDYKGLDCRGKILVLMVNDPPPTKEEPSRFNGASMSYYGRWVYKYEEAARQGAAGVLLIHTDSTATYPWSVVLNSFSGERFQAAERRGNPLEGWITDAFARRIFQAAGQDLEALRTRAATREFRPVELGLRLKGNLAIETRRLTEFNVAGLLPGTDPGMKQDAVIYSAHWDHLGLAEPDKAVRGDRIYNGAADNASGCAALLAVAEAAATCPARRSQIFLFVCAEEQGLWGSSSWTKHPLWPLANSVADLNLDSLNIIGPTRDAKASGHEHTTLGPLLAELAKQMGLRLLPPEPDLGGGYFRSDHFPFVRAGVPAVSLGSGSDFLGDAASAKEKLKAFYARYHQVKEEYDPSCDLGGMVQDAQFALNVGLALANSRETPRLLSRPITGK